MCELCGKHANPPNLIISKGHVYHLGCLADDYRELKAADRLLVDRCQAAGTWGPWADGWQGSYDEQFSSREFA